MNLTHDVYFSYSRDDSPSLVKKIMDWFGQKNKRIWEKNFPGSKSTERESKDAFLDANTIILLISEYSFTDETFSKELNYLKNTGKRAFVLQFNNNFPADWLAVIPNYCLSDIFLLSDDEEEDEETLNELLSQISRHEDVAAMYAVLAKAAFQWNYHSNAIATAGSSAQLALFDQVADFQIVNYASNFIITDLIYAYAAELRATASGNLRDVFFAYEDEFLAVANELYLLAIREQLSVWMANKLGISAKNLNDEVKSAIEKSASFIYFITQNGVSDDDMLELLRYAQSMNKRIIPVLVDKVVKKTIPSDVRKLVILDLTSEDNETRKIATDKIISVMLKDKDLVNIHRDFLVKALQWERSGYQLKYLLRGFELEKANSWLEENSSRSD